jgi:hypothetical protein
MQEERFNSRDRSYSAWHRRNSLRRFVGIECAQTLTMIDLDASLYVEYDDGTKEPLALIETAMDTGQERKPATVTKKLAQRAGIPAYILLYRRSETQRNPADEKWPDIESFRVRRITCGKKPPAGTPDETGWNTFTPQEWACQIIEIRHRCAASLDAEFFEYMPNEYASGAH